MRLFAEETSNTYWVTLALFGLVGVEGHHHAETLIEAILASVGSCFATFVVCGARHSSGVPPGTCR